jgi:hypothetical protein
MESFRESAPERVSRKSRSLRLDHPSFRLTPVDRTRTKPLSLKRQPLADRRPAVHGAGSGLVESLVICVIGFASKAHVSYLEPNIYAGLSTLRQHHDYGSRTKYSEPSLMPSPKSPCKSHTFQRNVQLQKVQMKLLDTSLGLPDLLSAFPNL